MIIMKKSFIDKFYCLRHINRHRRDDNRQRYIDSLSHACGNDDNVIRIVYGLAEKLVGIPNDFEIQNNSNWPLEVRSRIQSMQSELRLVGLPIGDDFETMRCIRSRYAQFGGEIQDYVDYLSDKIQVEVDDIKFKLEKSKQQKPAAASGSE